MPIRHTHLNHSCAKAMEDSIHEEAVLLFWCSCRSASLAFAQRIDELNGKHTQMYPTKDKADKDVGDGKAKPGGGAAQNLINHGGPVIASARDGRDLLGPHVDFGLEPARRRQTS